MTVMAFPPLTERSASMPGRGSFVSNVAELKHIKQKETLQKIRVTVHEAKVLGVSDTEINEAVKGGLNT